MSLHNCVHHLLHLTFHKLLTQLRTSRSFNFTSSSHALVTAYVTNTAIRRIAALYHTPFFTAITDSLLCLLLAMLFCLLLAMLFCLLLAMLLLHGFLGSDPGCFFFFFFFFFWSSLKLCNTFFRPRFVTTLDMHCLLSKFLTTLDTR